MNIRLLMFAILLLPLMQSLPAAQEVGIAQPVAATDSRLVTARQLMTNRNWEAAAAMLEVIYESDETNQPVINLLKNCYGQLKQFGKLETLVRRQLEVTPNNLTLRLELAESLADQGRKDEAADAYKSAEKLIAQADRGSYLLLVRSQLRHGLEDETLDLIARIRKDAHDSTLFALERGTLLEGRKKYQNAVREYLPVLAADTTPEAIEVERRIILLLDFPESSKDVENLLVAESQTKPNSRVVRLLADYYVRTNRFEEAFAFTTRRDSLEDLQGQSVIALIRQCYDRKLYAEAARFGEWAIAHSTQSPSILEARLFFARSLARLGKTDQAFAQYDTVIAGSPRDADKGQALFEKGEIYADLLGNYQRALACFDSVVNYYRVGIAYVEAMRNRPFCYLRMGKMEDARAGFTFLKEHPITDDIEEESGYYLGMIRFLEGEYDSANVAFRKLMVDHPTGFYVNDALQMSMVLSEAKDSPELLADYAQALFAQEKKDLDSTRIWLDRLARAENPALADVALHRLTLICLQLADTTGALDCIQRLDTGFTDSYFRPYGLKLKADILSLNRTTLEEARGIYKSLLEQFPNYPFASDIRKRLKQIETDFKLG